MVTQRPNWAKLTYRLLVAAKTILRPLLPKPAWLALRSALQPRIARAGIEHVLAAEWKASRMPAHTSGSLPVAPAGVNVVGYLRTAKGIAQVARGNLAALAAAGIPYSAVDYEVDIPWSQQLSGLAPGVHPFGFRYSVNLIHVNPPQLPFLWGAYGKSALAQRHTIGVWYWELAQFPEEYSFAFDLVDEVWVGSDFVRHSIAARSPVPVIKIPPCVQVDLDPQAARSDYNLPPGSFLFLCAFDVLSIQARKNPLGAIEAFKRAFSPDDASVGLVIKISHATEDPILVQTLRDAVRGYSNCFILDRVLPRKSMLALLQLTDAFVSLHRSEGFGLIGAEAMYLGKPVVMTNWSGNLDYMTEANSCPVECRLVPVGANAGPYGANEVWADPDLDQAAGYMSRLRSDPAFRASLSEAARRTIEGNYSPAAVGRHIRSRLEALKLL